MTSRRYTIPFLAASMLGSAGADAGPPLEAGATMVASDAAAYDAAGGSLSLDGSFLAFGVRGRDDGGTNRGAVYLSRWGPAGWAEVQKVTPALPADREEFGHATCLRAGLLGVGAPLSDRESTDAGSAWIFESNGVSFIEVARLQSPSGAAGARFGCSVALPRGGPGKIVVGAMFDDVEGVAAGRAHLFERSGGAWSLAASFRGPGVVTANDEFGAAVAVDGDTVAVGAPGEDSTGVNAGAVFIFRRTSGSWNLEQELRSPAPEALGEFGSALSLSGERLAVGAYREDGGAVDAGRVHVYRRIGTTWQLEQSLQSTVAAASSEFGIAVEIEGGALAVGSSRCDGGAVRSGGAYLFRRSTADWIPVARLASPGSLSNEFAGSSVGLSGLRVAFGAPLRSAPLAYQGAAFLSDLSADCDDDLVPDAVELLEGASDCDGNGVPDGCDIASGAADGNGNGIPDSCEIVPCSADLTGNDTVNGADLSLLLSVWGTSGAKFDADLNDDGIVGAPDLAILLSSWGPCP